MTIKWRLLILPILLLISACGSLEEPPPTRIPTVTPTKISTPLPYVPTAVPAGFSSDNPVQIVIVPADAAVASERLAEFESTLQGLTDVSVTVVLVESQEEAYDLVCASGQGVISAAWLDGMRAVANELAGCGIGVLQADTADGTNRTGVFLQHIPPVEETDEDGEESTDDGSDSGEDTGDSDEELEGLATTLGQPFCRTGVDSLFGWSLPLLYYGAEGIPAGDITEITDVADNDALIAGLTSGDCFVGGMSEEEWDAYLDADTERTLDDTVEVILTSPPVPYNIFSFSTALSLDAIADIESALRQMEFSAGRAEPDAEATEDPEAASISVESDLMSAFFGDGALVPVNDSDYTPLFDLFAATGIAFPELDN